MKKHFTLMVAVLAGLLLAARCVEAEKANPTAGLMQKGNARFDKGDYDGAAAAYSEAIKLDPKNGDAFRGRAAAYRRKRAYGQAIADYSQLLRLDPHSAEVYILRGDVYDVNGDYDKAIADLNEAIRLDPKSASAHWHRGFAYEDAKKLSKAIADFTEAIRLDPNDPEGYFGADARTTKKANMTRRSPTARKPSACGQMTPPPILFGARILSEG